MAALAAIIRLFTRIVRRGQVYEVLYVNAISTKDGTISNLRSILVDLYVSAMELLARCDILIESGVVRQTLNSILRPEQVSDLISDLSEKEQILSYEIQSCEALRNEKATKQLDEKLNTLLARLDVPSPPLTRIDEGVAELLENVNNDKLEKLMDFISSEQFGKGHATMKDTRIQGTGDWLIDHESFQEWQAIASSSTLLCLQGTSKLFCTLELGSSRLSKTNSHQLVPAKLISHPVWSIILNKHWKHLLTTKDLPFSTAIDLDHTCKIHLLSFEALFVSCHTRQTTIAMFKATSFKNAKKQNKKGEA